MQNTISKKRALPRTPEGLAKQAKRAAWAVFGEVVGASLGLLVVVAVVLFFYLFCLPWMGGTMNGDETRISRRTEGRGEFREVSAGCFSGSPRGESEEASPQAYTPQKGRQRQGLERFLLPRPCLRRVAAGLFIGAKR